MKSTSLLLLALALSLSVGCAKKVKTSYEPDDPTDMVTTSKDELPGLLRETVLHFGYDDATLTMADQKKLNTLAMALKARPWASVRIAGHCDERGTEEYNLALGQRRADAARAYLLALGVAEDAVETVTFGEEMPIDFDGDEAAWAVNRRAEFGPVPLQLFGYLDGEQ